VVTLDQSLQFEVEKQLTAQVASAKARGGIAIVADVQTGDVLAMAAVDGATDQHPARIAPASESNRPLTAVYEPGSTAKVITVGGALEAGVVDPATSFWVPDHLQIADRLFKDAEVHSDASWTVNDIVRQSSNIGVIKIAEKLGKERLDRYQRAFGFGSKTSIDFPAESAGLMKNVKDYVPSDMGSIPIGYTTAVTPMQMLNVFVTVANGGVSRPPRLVAATIGSDGARQDLQAKRGTRVVSEKTAAELNLMLRSVVTDGTGTGAKISGYTVAGKTGTSRKPPYEPARYMASFAGFAPAESPRLAAIVVIDQPGTNDEAYFGGKVAAPLFSRIMQYALRIERVPPTTVMSSVASDPGPPLATVPTQPTPSTTTTTNPIPGLAASALAPPPAVPAGIVSQPKP
jgi:cell division protein FtsI (penicillin-binding protein 3)